MAYDMDGFRYVPESESRKLDMRVQREEMPYGYEGNPPAADSQNYQQRKLESKKVYGSKRRG